MATVTYMGQSFPCAKAIKGDNYVHLVDENGVMIGAFDGVTDFSKFSISSGSWTEPAAMTKNSVAVVKEDGTNCSCGVPLENFYRSDTATVLTRGVHYDDTLPSTGVEGQLFFLLV